MKKLGLILIVLFAQIALPACQPKKIEHKTHPKLIGAQNVYVGEPGDPDSHAELDLVNEDKVVVEYKDSYLLVKTWRIVNACGKRFANIEIEGDTIKLQTMETAEELCMSVEIEQTIYFIDNQEKQEWVVIKR